MVFFIKLVAAVVVLREHLSRFIHTFNNSFSRHDFWIINSFQVGTISFLSSLPTQNVVIGSICYSHVETLRGDLTVCKRRKNRRKESAKVHDIGELLT